MVNASLLCTDSTSGELEAEHVKKDQSPKGINILLTSIFSFAACHAILHMETTQDRFDLNDASAFSRLLTASFFANVIMPSSLL